MNTVSDIRLNVMLAILPKYCDPVKHVILACFSADDPWISPVTPAEPYDDFSEGARD